MNSLPAAELRRRTEAAADACLAEAMARTAPERALHGAFTWTEAFTRGELAGNHALCSAATLGLAPAALSEALAREAELPEAFAALTAAGPGFLNFRLSDRWYDAALAALSAREEGPLPDFSPARFPTLDPALALRQDAASPLYRLRWAYARSRTLLEEENAPDGTGNWGDAERALLLRMTLPDGERGLFALADAFARFYGACPIRSAPDKGFRLKLLAACCRTVEHAAIR